MTRVLAATTAIVSLTALAVLGGCGSPDDKAQAPEVKDFTAEIVTPTPEEEPAGPESVDAKESTEPAPYILFNQKWIENLSSDSVDLNDVDAVFWHEDGRTAATAKCLEHRPTILVPF